MTDHDIAWENPPARGGPGKFDGVRDALKANPGRWALVKSYSTQQNAYSVGWTCFKPHGFEITTRGGDLYVRWPEQ